MKNFSEDVFKQLLPIALQNNPELGKSYILWQYLREKFYSLDDFTGLNLIPVVTKRLEQIFPVKKNQLWLIADSSFTSGVRDCLKALGVTIIETVEYYVKEHRAITNNYLFEGNQGFQMCLQMKTLSTRKFNQLQACHRREFCQFVYSHMDSKITGQARNILCSLPMFEDLREGTNTLISIQDAKFKASEESPPYDINEKYIHIGKSYEDRYLAENIGVTICSLSEIIQTCILDRFTYYSEQDKCKWIPYILQNIDTLTYQNYGILAKLSQTDFVKTESGKRKKPSSLFSGMDSDLKVLGNKDSDFPVASYDKFHDALVNLGLKTESCLTADDILYFVKKIQHQKDAMKQYTVTPLINLLNKRVDLLQNYCSGKELYKHLLDIHWIPVQRTPPGIYPQSLPWKGEHQSYATPQKVFLYTEGNIYTRGGVDLIIERTANLPTRLCDMYNWNSSPDADSMIKQLQLMKQHYITKYKAAYTLEVEHIYASLETCQLLQKHQQLLSDLLWMGDGFVNVDLVIEKPPVRNMEPYIYQVPESMLTNISFYRRCGVKNTCDPFEILKKIKYRHDQRDPNSIKYRHDQRDPTSKEEISRERKLAVDLLRYITENKPSDAVAHALVPVESHYLQLEPVAKCTYHKKQWKQNIAPMSLSLPEGTFLVHKEVEESIVKHLQIKPLAAHKLKAENLQFEGFGQNEPLTLRIQNILRNYKDGFAVPKELIQNADDAKATEVKLLYDQRENLDHRESLFDPAMEECQGPALWAYNNAQFSEEDFQNITKLASGSKEFKNDTVGRFGLGFNSVYNLTDVPSFISGKHLVIFDPHTTYLEDCIGEQRKPGVRVEISKEKVSDYKDQFNPFNGIFGWNISKNGSGLPYPGTLFRFPLRTRQQAEKSEISKLSYDRREIVELLKKLVEAGSFLLLFTQHVKSVSVFVINNGDTTSDMKCLIQVNKSRVKVFDGNDILLENQLAQAAECVRKQKPDELRSAAILKTSVKLTPPGKQLLGIQQEYAEYHFLICNISGTGKSFEVAKQKHNLVPLAGVAMQIEIEGSEYKAVEDTGHLFCFLPLPIETGLPIHVNGFFSVTSDRRQIEQLVSDDKVTDEATWNQILLEEVACAAYLYALEILSKHGTRTPYYYIWPDFDSTLNIVTCMLKNFFKQLSTSSTLALFSDRIEWKTVSDTVFLAEKEFRSKELKAAAENILKIVEPGKIVIDMPSRILKQFHKAGVYKKIEPHCFSKESFFRNILLPNINMSAVEEEPRNILIKHALEDKETRIWLNETACIPVSPAGKTLKKASELIHPRGLASKLYMIQDEKYPLEDDVATNRSYCSQTILQSLEVLGMSRDIISWDDILERAENISKLNTKRAYESAVCLLHMMELKITRSSKETTDKYIEKLKTIPFLPVKREEKSCFKWKSERDGTELASSENCFTADHGNQVGLVALVVNDVIFQDNFQVRKKLLGIKSPPIETVIQQYSFLVKEVNSMRNNEESLPADVIQEVSILSLAVYEFLNRFCYGNNQLEEEIIRKHLRQCGLWMEKVFVSPDTCCLNFTERCSPWLNEIPSAVERSCRNFLLVAGVKEAFSESDFINALQRIKLNYDHVEGEILDIAIRIIQALVKGKLSAETLKQYGKVYIPDEEGYLRDSSCICFADKDCFVEKDNDTYFVHPNLPIKAGKVLDVLGVKSVRQHVVSRRRRGIPFGQKELLTSRIRRILDGYSSESILKELVQNADDAGATEMHFVLDERLHQSQKLFSEGWKAMQGPSLIVYNNKPFTQEDLNGIHDLGSGSKSSDPRKTGQYGVGFNCVYHLTDTPTFLTEIDGKEILVAFDPNLKYVEGATIEEPGSMYEETDSLRKQFPDVFSPYKIPSLQHGTEKGTVFRFPLRTVSQAAVSDLRKHETPISEVKELFQLFRSEIKSVLMFLNNLQSIKISVVSEDKNVHEEYMVQCSLGKEDYQKKIQFKKEINDARLFCFQNDYDITKIERKEISLSQCISDSDGNVENWFVVHALGFEGDLSFIQGSWNKDFQAEHLNLLPCGGVAGIVSKETVQRSKEPHIKEPHIRYTDKENRFLYCTLPLPLETGLHVHVNGHFILDYESRRNMWIGSGEDYRSVWNRLLMENVVAPSYISFLKGMQNKLLTANREHIPIQPCQSSKERQKCNCHSCLTVMKCIEKYNTFFPKFSQYPYVELLTKAVYHYMDEHHANVMPVLWKPVAQGPVTLAWFPPRKHGSLEAVVRDIMIQAPKYELPHESEQRREKQEQLSQLLIHCGYTFFETTYSVIQNFKTFKIELQFSTSEHILEFFKKSECTTCHIENLPMAIDNTCLVSARSLSLLLEYIGQCRDFQQDLLHDAPLLLTADGILKKYSSNETIYCSGFADLGSKHPSLFMHKEIIHSINWKLCGENPVIKSFDMNAIALMLEEEIGNELHKCATFFKPWTTENVNLSQKWLSRFWDFAKFCCEQTEFGKQSEVSEHILFTRIMEPLSSWSLLPGKSGERHFLAPIGKPLVLVNLKEGGDISQKLRDAFSKLNLAELNFDLVDRFAESFSGEMIRYENMFVRSVVSTVSKPEWFMKALQHWIQESQVACTVLKFEEDEQKAVLDYFAEYMKNQEQNAKNRELHDAIKKLPVFLTVTEDCIPIHGLECYIVPKYTPLHGLKSIGDTKGFVFLSYPNENHLELMKALGCKIMSDVELYCQCVLPHFNLLSGEQIWDHIEYIISIWNRNKQKQKQDEFYTELHRTLNWCRFIPVEDDRLASASDFYSPDEPVFQLILPRIQFPPDISSKLSIMQERWIKFLVDIGLRVTVTEEIFVKVAKTMEQEAKTCATEKLFNQIKRKTQILLYNLYCKQPFSPHLLENFCVLKLFPLEKGKYCELHPQYAKTSQYDFVSLKGGVVLNQWETEGHDERDALVWAVAKLLPYWTDPADKRYFYKENAEGQNKQLLVKSLGIYTGKIPVKLIIENVKNICVNVKQQMKQGNVSQSMLNLLGNIMEISYKHLSKELSNMDLVLLQECPFVLVQSMEGVPQLVRPCQVAIEMPESDQIPPYLYRLPRKLGKYDDLLMKLGVTENPTVDQYLNLLNEMYNECRDSALHANEKQMALRALFALMILFMKQRSYDNSIDLYILAADSTLRKPNNLCYIDDPIYKDRVGEISEMIIASFKDLHDIPQIKSSTHWKEIEKSRYTIFESFPEKFRPCKLSSQVKEVIVECHKLVENTSFASNLAYRFHHPQFLAALRRLLRANEKHENEVVNAILNNIQECQTISVSLIRTRLSHKENIVTNSDKDLACYINMSESPVKLYISKKSEDDNTVFTTLPHILNHLLLQGLADKHALSEILQRDLDCLQKVLDELQIEEDFADNEFRTLPQCGEYIPIVDHHLLCPAFEPLSVGEYVGFAVDFGEIDADQPIYMYCRVIEEVTKEEELLQRPYRVDFGLGISKVVKLLDLFRFHRKREILTAETGQLVESEGDPSDDIDLSDDEIKAEIRKILEGAWKLSDQEKRKVIRRLLLKWHPDKNPDKKEMCTEMCQFIQQEMHRLEKVTGEASRDFKSYYADVGTWARRQYAERQKYQRHHTSTDFQRGRYPPWTGGRNPQPGEAKRWIRQARFDLKAASTDLGKDVEDIQQPANYEWVCFKYHQVCIGYIMSENNVY